MPLVILVAAAGLVFWGRHRDGQRYREAHEFASALGQDVWAGLDPAPRLTASSTLITTPLLPRLSETLTGVDTWSVIVMRGDTGETANAGDATHHAVFMVDGLAALGLRLDHRGGPAGSDRIAIIGFWLPQAP